MTDKIRLPFDPVEQLIRVRHPDTNGNRQAQAKHHGGICAAVWLAEVLTVDRRKIESWRVNGVKYFDADLIATKLCEHAGAIWPEWNLVEIAPQELPVWQQLRAAALVESMALREQAQQMTAA